MATDAKRKAAEALLHVLPLPGREAGWAREARAAARTRLLDHIEPDVVHVMADGRIVESGGPELALRVEAEGYTHLQKSVA